MWLHKEKVIEKIEDMPQGTFGFIYITTHKPSGMSYIGKKIVISQC
jgi:ubiquinone biosynthesis protein Coq4